jgi:L-rhamnose mutarotase
MKRFAFKMRIPTEHITEYKKRHDEIWPELVDAHRKVGISDYSIFFDEETGLLFAYLLLTEDNTMDRMGEMDIVKEWWRQNVDIQDYEGETPYFRPLIEVFHMD